MPFDPAPTATQAPAPPASARAALPRGAERRRFRRVETPLDLRYLHDGAEGTGRLLDVSAGGARIGADLVPAKGDRIVLYADRLGRFEAEVVRANDGSNAGTGEFAVRFTHRLGRAKRLADALTWVLNRPPERDRRRARRYPQDKPAQLVRADGSVSACRILDISTTGASVGVASHHRPPIGETVTLGVMRARIVRHHAEGIGVLFDEAQPTVSAGSAAPSAASGAAPSPD